MRALIARDSKTMHSISQLESQDCPVYNEMRGPYEKQWHTLGMYQKSHTQYLDTYNPSWQNHPNPSWSQESYQPTQTPQPRSYSTP